ncbi:MAG: YkgJ family cysteine cluster protein [Desulfobulbaceae bacterium]|uniref:YkgJ family cysteine cluster protein n=1 Tax=Candidatus Desulfatifera sulfidica TaxID=2841691 RepID=A0A8J6NAI8_9BACT|nr:YkgJ family cysteine cluster protein [Candidatus Desulfatifera sulfidica]
MLRENQSECYRCGTCCRKGGPALHGPDLELIRSGRIPRKDLITIRRGELVFNPVADGVQPVAVELVKLRGVGSEWSCCYYDTLSRGCMIYDHRPQACESLKCWRPKESLALVEQDCLTRLDIMDSDDPLRVFVKEHEQLCTCPDLGAVPAGLERELEKTLSDLQRLVDNDLLFRQRILDKFDLDLAEELFYFGRPIFQILAGLGVQAVNHPGGVRLKVA